LESLGYIALHFIDKMFFEKDLITDKELKKTDLDMAVERIT